MKKKLMIILLGSLLSFNTIQANESILEEPTPDTFIEIPDYETPTGFSTKQASEDASMVSDNEDVTGYGNLVINKQLITHIWHTECDVMGNQAWVPDIDNPTGDRSREGHRLDHCGQPGNWIIYLDENGTPYMLEEKNAGGANGGTLTARFYSDGTYTQEIGIDDINLNERIYFTTENDYQGRHQVWHHSGIAYPENPTFKFYIGDGVYELHAGETLTLENLPAGTYQIVEEYNPEFYPSSVSVGFELDENSNVIATATVNSDQTTEVDFVNERITERPEPTPTPIPPVESEPESVPESVPESIPESVPESIPESVPESVPESIPESIPESVPESIPDPIESEPESISDPVESEPEVPHDIINNIDNSTTTNTTTTNTDNSVTNTTTTNNTDNSVTNNTTTNTINNTTTTTTTNNTDNSITNNTTTTTNTNNTDNSVTNTTTTTNTNTNNSTTYTDIFDLDFSNTDNSITTTTNNDVDVSNVLSYNETNIQKSNSSSSNVRIDKSTKEISTDNSKVVKKDEFISEDNDITNNHSNTSVYSPSTATITTNNYQRPNTQAIITPSNQSYKNTSTTTTTPTYNTTTTPKETVTNNNNDGKYQTEPVKTGDESPIIVLIIACILSLGVILYIVFGKKEI